jgi:hypothetical protein
MVALYRGKLERSEEVLGGKDPWGESRALNDHRLSEYKGVRQKRGYWLSTLGPLKDTLPRIRLTRGEN